MTYHTLLTTHWTGFVRSMQSPHTRPISPGQAILGLYVAVVLVCSGLLFGPFFAEQYPPVHQLNKHLFGLFAALVVIRFLFQQTPRVRPNHYLHLPIDRGHLVRYVQIVSAVNIYSLFPLFFFVPFGIRYLHTASPIPGGIWLWSLGIASAVLATHYLTMALRMWLTQNAFTVLFLVGAVLGLESFDHLAGRPIVGFASAFVFDSLLEGYLPSLGLLMAGCAAAYVASSLSLRHGLLKKQSGQGSPDTSLPMSLPFRGSTLRNLVLLELKMMWRSSRTRQYVLVSIVVSTAYTALLLSELNLFVSERWMWALIGLFASGAFVLNYGQLMFAWESRYFDGLMARATPIATMVQAKIMLLQASCIALFLISLPLFVAMAPHLLPLHVAFLFYNAGITSGLMVLLAVHNHKRVDLTSGGFFEYEGFSAIHWLWMIPTVAPPALILMLMPDRTHFAFSLIALLGLAGMLLSWPWSQYLARRLTRRKHTMAAGFRHSND